MPSRIRPLFAVFVAGSLSACMPYPASSVAPVLGASPFLVTTPVARTDAARTDAARTVRLVAAVRPQPVSGWRLLTGDFGPWDGSRVAKLIVTVLDGGDSVGSTERLGALRGDEEFEFAELKIDRVYTIQLEARDAGDTVISVAESSRAEVDTGELQEEGSYPDQIAVDLPLTFDARRWPGKVRANVTGPLGTDSIVVKLQQPALTPGEWETIRESTVGGATGHVAYDQLRIGEAYRVLAVAMDGGRAIGQSISDEFSAEPSDSDEVGTLPDLDLTIPSDVT